MAFSSSEDTDYRCNIPPSSPAFGPIGIKKFNFTDAAAGGSDIETGFDDGTVALVCVVTTAGTGVASAVVKQADTSIVTVTGPNNDEDGYIVVMGRQPGYGV